MKITLFTLLCGCLLLTSLPAWSASTKEEIQALSAQVEAMQKDLTEIKEMLKKAPPAAARAPAAAAFKEQTVSVGDAPFKGQADATVTLMEFSDYQCPYCARNYRDVMPTLVKEYVDTGKLKFVMREKPIASLHRNAVGASMAALCANDQGKYWEMHNVMFENQRALTDDNLKTYASNMGINTSEFDQCLDSKKYAKQIDEDIVLATGLGISGTPGFILGLTDPADPDKAKMTKFIKGAQSLAVFKATIDELLKTAN